MRRILVRNSTTYKHNPFKENPMSSKKTPPVVRNSSKKIADQRRVRFGGGCAPRVLRAQDARTSDSRAVRFGGGCCPAALRK